jgi:RNA polymerase sigma-70 factor (ECF subfamily)
LSLASTRLLKKHSTARPAVVDEDHELVRRCQQCERQAQYELYQRYKDRIYSIAYRMSNNRQEAEDISQNIFLRVFDKIDSFRGEAAFSSWLYRLAMNVCINHFHSDKKRKEKFPSTISDLQEVNSPALKAKEEPPHLKPYLEKAIRALPAGYRMVFILYDIEGYQHHEICKMMNISEGTSKSQLHRARKELRRLLEPYVTLHEHL